MGLWRVYFERKLEDLAYDWLRQLVSDFVLALSWIKWKQKIRKFIKEGLEKRQGQRKSSAGEADRFPQARKREELTSSARGSVREDESVEDEESIDQEDKSESGKESVEDEESTHQEGQNESGEENAEDEKSTDQQEENESGEEREEETNHVLFEQRKKVLHDENAAPSRSNFADDSNTEIPECIKSIDLTKYSFKTHYSAHGDIPGKIFVKSPLGGKAFLEFRGVLIEQGLLDRFKKSCFGHFMDIPMQRVNFGSLIVHGLLL
ncbi:uncharacterized protein LOC132062213 [Lycium ferocissimum]|uniref:uncharacterized protein LOC132062213 n=1 Tax=Lycium ferocissimum TaxID=112874 RepID=UPI0028164309|nr:uncharacterized protein LOC132062213 [Lycium ferocissimum]